ncbi:hypothetical protein HRG_001688 [Hirsutella rhossiliensis]|uniref:2EXR domain-containing protein n=1 Tax=Hirsutella rhossiliensis TaxID=111463 RepID=A0A9P8N3R4_9HYPO|nr:uncharacterized protein HRG_01688 [Hirsutella rhossiliensis]KAH0966279.1 hypothetical protein HRG_01688 [Hirsutella rhossiliensis]
MATSSRDVDAVDRETEAYNELMDNGGRPSHPLELLQTIVEAPGEYRDILSYWQSHPNQWQVFRKQLSAWKNFQAFQMRSREAPKFFPNYVYSVEADLARNGFNCPTSSVSMSVALKHDLSLQGKLETWIEYLCYLYREQELRQEDLDQHRGGYGIALRDLRESGVLGTHETDEDTLERLSDPAGMETARLMVERCRHTKFAGGNPKSESRETRKILKRIDKRIDCMTQFSRDSCQYRSARDAIDHHGTLVRWVLAQISLIGKETRAAAPEQGPSTFESFLRLPCEIRRQIWLESPPVGPQAHFFDIINHPRKRNMAHLWSSSEFGVRATRARDSGYLPVYALLAACRDSRLLVAAHYRQLGGGAGANEAHDRWCEPENPFGNFETFNWIPAHDLVVLCFPPRQAQLPSANALTLDRGPARRVGILVTEEMYFQWGYGLDYNGRRPESTGNGWNQGPVQEIFPVQVPDHDGSQIGLIPDYL